MFGNGQEQPQAQDTASIWGDMFGIGSLFKVITDPQLQAHTHAMLAAVIEGASATRRVEQKLDRLLKALGHEIDDINARFPSEFIRPAAPALLEANGAVGDRGRAAATVSADDGGRNLATNVGTDGDDPRNGGADDARPGARS